MNLCIDIGNKKTKIGIFKGRKLIKFLDFLTSAAETFSFPEDWKNIEIKNCGISSVVPSINLLIKEKIENYFKIKPVFLDYKNCKIKIKVKNPTKTGIDRIVNCKGALEILGCPIVVIDIGSATTIDVVDGKSTFIGGFILPGPELWINSIKSTALIKKIDNSIVLGYIGKETSSAINLGLKYGLTGAIEKIISLIKRKFPNIDIVLTGGYCLKFSKNLNFEKKIRRYLTLEGINIILEENDS
ncbi:MAG: type III pantothenate kinase [Candidatus Omnitrophica bacterium]|nr:type III pantothenate kinase [Candidatus Omnitrophota bacterium]MCM8806624.1 type III pantothenate kinase [Candidatus Omnitrophota bacterium]